jgi:beta-N-acetylhexosaminidase
VLVARHVGAFVEGLQGVGVAACAKHFPGHGETAADSHVELPVAETDPETMLRRALPPFRAAVEAGVRAVMTAHIRFTAFADEPATLSSELIGLLRSDLGFAGLVLTDALEMRAISGTAGLEEGAVRALGAGADALCLGADRTPSEVERVHAAIVEAVRSGRLAEERVLEAARRVAATAAWASAPSPERDLEAGAEAARCAVSVEGDAAVGKAAVVIELWPDPTIAAGEARHGLGELLGAETIRLRNGDPLPALGSDRQVVFVTRDAHRHLWQRELVVPGSVVVETGLPEWHPSDARAFVATHGAGRVNLEAAAELLRGH